MSADRLALVDRELLLRIIGRNKASAPENPLLREIDSTESQIDKINNSKSSNPIHTLNKVNNLISSRNAYVEDYENKPSRPPLEAVISGMDGIAAVGGSDGRGPHPARENHIQSWTRKILNAAPPRAHRTIKNLMAHIEDSDRMSFTPGGQLWWDGQAIGGTSIFDLVHAVTRSRKATPLPGIGDFITALGEINTPTELIPNARPHAKAVRAMFDGAPARKKRKNTGRSPSRALFADTPGPRTVRKGTGVSGARRGHDSDPLFRRSSSSSSAYSVASLADSTAGSSAGGPPSSAGSTRGAKGGFDPDQTSVMTPVMTPASEEFATPMSARWRSESRTPAATSRRPSRSGGSRPRTSRKPLRPAKGPKRKSPPWEKFKPKRR